jgi:hypothetical protein
VNANGVTPVATWRQVALGTGDHDGNDQNRRRDRALKSFEPTLMLAHSRFGRNATLEWRFDELPRSTGASARPREREAKLLYPRSFLDDRIGLPEEIGWNSGIGQSDDDDLRRRRRLTQVGNDRNPSIDGSILVEDDHVRDVFTDGSRGVPRCPRLSDDDVACLVEQETNEATFECTLVSNDGARRHSSSPHGSLQWPIPVPCIDHHGGAYSYPTGLLRSTYQGIARSGASPAPLELIHLRGSPRVRIGSTRTRRVRESE